MDATMHTHTQHKQIERRLHENLVQFFILVLCWVKRNYLFYFLIRTCIFHSFIGDKKISTTNNNKYSFFVWVKCDCAPIDNSFFFFFGCASSTWISPYHYYYNIFLCVFVDDALYLSNKGGYVVEMWCSVAYIENTPLTNVLGNITSAIYTIFCSI